MESERFLVLLLFLGQASALVLDVPDTYGENLTYTSIAGLHEFRLFEGMTGTITLANFEYEGSLQLSDIQFFAPDTDANDHLGLELATIATGLYQLTITKEQDFESTYFTQGLEIYRFIIQSDHFVIFLLNVNDNSPVILPNNSTCEIEENTMVPPNCGYIITDADGHMQNFELKVPDLENIFEVVYEEEITLDTIKEIRVQLQLLQELDYEQTILYVMDVTVTDTEIQDSDRTNSDSTKTVVRVIDVADTDPIWITIFASQQFKEKSTRTFDVFARDGDFGINNEIFYYTDGSWANYISIDEKTGTINVKEIDRDEDAIQIYQFMIFACEVPDENACVTQSISFLVDDINDQFPIITVSTEEININETYYGDLDLTMAVYDRDIGDNAMYEITFSSEQSQSNAFTIAPSSGYQETNLYMYITNFRLLDYEDPDFRDFTITITAMDIPEPQNSHFKTIHFTLNNLNDEVPIFEFDGTDTTYYVELEETIELNAHVITVKASDRDVDDTITLSILGSYMQSLFSIDTIATSIDSVEGDIKTIVNRALDYETQEEVFIQIQAIDSLMEPYNTAIAQLTIKVIDVNDETPVITVGSDRIEIEENLSDGTVFVNSTIRYLVATDLDQNAELEFYIDWENSYATKYSRRVDDVFENYIECVTIDVVEQGSVENGKGIVAVATLTINEVREDNTPDYEEFDVLYLNIIVNDINQAYGTPTDSVIVPIYIIDIDDEPPEFVMSTITSEKSVAEESLQGTTIAVVIATDVDSDTIYYFISADDPAHEGLVDINDLGELFVNDRIDADGSESTEPIYDMQFTVTASDGERFTAAKINISVTDINDNSPEFTYPAYGDEFYVDEQEDDGYIIILQLQAIDGDRDPQNNAIYFDYGSNPLLNSDVRNYFDIDGESIIVSYKYEGSKLDRDNGIPGVSNDIYIAAIDRGATPLSGETMFTVILRDINNQVPTIITDLFNDKDENLKVGDVIGQIIATDDDEENTENTRINFELLSIRTIDGDEVPEDLFYLDNPDKDGGTTDLMAGRNLQGYFGTYILTIQAEDEGTIPEKLSSISDVTVQINKYNFYNPQFTFPTNGMHFNLRTGQTPNLQMHLYDDTEFPDFIATDLQGDKYELQFSVVDEESIFNILTMESTEGRLVVTDTPVGDETYTVTIRVQPVDATPVTSTEITITLIFLDLSREPIYENKEQTIEFVENSTTTLYATFNEAIIRFVPEGLNFPIFYMITGDNPAEFRIENVNENILSTTLTLDREETASYTITIPAFRTEGGQAVPSEDSILTLTINVLDINDNPPNFDQPIFYAIITATQVIGTNILTLTATDLDEANTLHYTIEAFPIIPGSVSSTEPFTVNELTGVITNEVQVLENVDGLFHLKVKVSDEDFFDTADVVIYIVSDLHRVEFLFENDVNIIDGSQSQIASILEAQFNYTCIIEQVMRNTDSDGNPIEDETIVRVYFIDRVTEKPILKEVVESSANDALIYLNLVTQFERYQLVLVSFLQNSSTTENREEALRAWLIGITLVLGVLCLLLLVAFILKTRSLSSRLNKLSVIRYGSQESVNNRRAAPFTNKHAAEGSNPAYNEDKVKSHDNEDAASIGSGDSDLVGVENNPEFDYNYEKQNPQTSTKDTSS